MILLPASPGRGDPATWPGPKANVRPLPPEGGEITVRAGIEPDGCFRLVVADTGIGMAKEDIPKALTSFTQLGGQLDRRQRGTGLGLPLVKSLVTLHGGTLELKSEPGFGTTVTVRFPPERTVTGKSTAENDAKQARAASTSG